MSDIIPSDAETEIRFRWTVQKFLDHRDSQSFQLLRTRLLQWKENDRLLHPYFAGNARLLAIQRHSENLAAAAAIGLEALDRIASKEATDSSWILVKTEAIRSMSKATGDTELSVLPDIISLINGKLGPRPASFSLF
jgi:hypothetical protein